MRRYHSRRITKRTCSDVRGCTVRLSDCQTVRLSSREDACKEIERTPFSVIYFVFGLTLASFQACLVFKSDLGTTRSPRDYRYM
jgi:hypothetical protein